MFNDERASRVVISADTPDRHLEGFIGCQAKPKELARLDVQTFFQLINLGNPE